MLTSGSEIGWRSADNLLFQYVAMEPGDEIIPAAIRKRYILAHKLGEGAFGVVSMVIDRDTNTRLAMKCLRYAKVTISCRWHCTWLIMFSSRGCCCI